MNETDQAQVQDGAAAKAKRAWIAPELSRFHAGDAESGDVNKPDGGSNPS